MHVCTTVAMRVRMLSKVLYEVDEHGVAIITLNAPKRMNTMSNALNTGVLCAIEMAEADPAVFVVCARIAF